MPADYYTSQSAVTDPGAMSFLVEEQPRDVSQLAGITNGLVLHYRGDDPLGHGLPPSRLSEIDTRYVDEMLARLHELDRRPLAERREPPSRLVGCCRDFTVLFLAMARAAGIPCRGRVGFASYFAPGFLVDHEVAEVLEDGRWKRVDPELAPGHVDPTDGAEIDPFDVPPERFVSGGAAWRSCREKGADPARFLVDPGIPLEELRGWPYLRHNLVHDLAAMNKHEMVLWDSWGLMELERSPATDERCDELAAVTAQADPSLEELTALYEQEGVRVPPVVTSHDPLGGPPRTVELRP